MRPASATGGPVLWAAVLALCASLVGAQPVAPVLALQPGGAPDVRVLDRNVYPGIWSGVYGVADTFSSPSYAFHPVDDVVVRLGVVNPAASAQWIRVRVEAEVMPTAGSPQLVDTTAWSSVPGNATAQFAVVFTSSPKPPGKYALRFVLEANTSPTPAGAATTATAELPDRFTVVQPAPDLSNAPVILVHGLSGGIDSFCDLEVMLERDVGRPSPVPRPVRKYLYPFAPQLVIRDAAGGLARFLDNCGYEAAGQPVHVVAHSMGGLVTQTWLSGLSTEAPGFGPPLRSFDGRSPVERFVSLGSPFGGNSAAGLALLVPWLTLPLAADFDPASELLWGLHDHRWTFLRVMGGAEFDTRVLNVAGITFPGGFFCADSDGIVSTFAATLRHVSPTVQTHFVEAQHTHSTVPLPCNVWTGFSLNGFDNGSGLCGGQPAPPGLYGTVRDFLTDGTPPAGGLPDPALTARVVLRGLDTTTGTLGGASFGNGGALSLTSGTASASVNANAASGAYWADLSDHDLYQAALTPGGGGTPVTFDLQIARGATRFVDVHDDAAAGAPGLLMAVAGCPGATPCPTLRILARNGLPYAPLSVVLGTSTLTLPLPAGPTTVLNPFEPTSLTIIDGLLGTGLFGPGWPGLSFSESGDVYFEIWYPPALQGNLTLKGQWFSIGTPTPPFELEVSDLPTISL